MPEPKTPCVDCGSPSGKRHPRCAPCGRIYAAAVKAAERDAIPEADLIYTGGWVARGGVMRPRAPRRGAA